MSFIKKTAPQKEEQVVSYKCCAHGCPLTGSISTVQNKWTCSFHFRAEPESWPMVTSAVVDSQPIFRTLAELRKLSEIEWSSSIKGSPPQRDFFRQLFDDQPDLKPNMDENKSHYEYRLMDHISVCAGVLYKRQGKTYVPTKPLTKFTNPADHLVRQPQRPFTETERDHDFL